MQEMQTATARNLKAELIRRKDYFEKEEQLKQVQNQLEDERVRSQMLHYHAEIAQSHAMLEALDAELLVADANAPISRQSPATTTTRSETRKETP